MWATPGPWFWYPSGTVGSISMYASGQCLVGRPSNGVILDYKQISTYYPSKFQDNFLFS